MNAAAKGNLSEAGTASKRSSHVKAFVSCEKQRWGSGVQDDTTLAARFDPNKSGVMSGAMLPYLKKKVSTSWVHHAHVLRTSRNR